MYSHLQLLCVAVLSEHSTTPVPTSSFPAQPPTYNHGLLTCYLWNGFSWRAYIGLYSFFSSQPLDTLTDYQAPFYGLHACQLYHRHSPANLSFSPCLSPTYLPRWEGHLPAVSHNPSCAPGGSVSMGGQGFNLPSANLFK